MAKSGVHKTAKTPQHQKLVLIRLPPSLLLQAWAFQVYWFTKYWEWLDTAFMMLRGRGRQLSFLHIYHHSAMVLLSDYGANVSPWPAMGFPLGLNSLVHVFVYAYYAASSFGPVHPRYKKTLTQVTPRPRPRMRERSRLWRRE